MIDNDVLHRANYLYEVERCKDAHECVLRAMRDLGIHDTDFTQEAVAFDITVDEAKQDFINYVTRFIERREAKVI